MKNAKLLSAILAVLILVVCSAMAMRVHNTAAAPAEEEGEKDEESKPVAVQIATVHSGSLAETLRVAGTLQPLPNGQSKVAAQVSGRLQNVFVRPGQLVHSGDLLATVSRPELQEAVRQAEAGVREAERELDALRAERDTHAQALPLQERRAQADVTAAQAHVATVKAGSRPEEIDRAEAALAAEQATLDQLKAGARPQEIAQAQAAVRDAAAQRDAMQKDVTRKRGLLEKGIAAAKEVERAEADLATAQATLDAKQQALDLLRAGTRPEEIRAQQSKVREAQAQLRQAKAGARPEEIREAESAVTAAQAEVDQARAARSELNALDQRLRSAATRVDAARAQARAAAETASRSGIRAPISGTVAQVFVNVGDGVSEQSPVVEILNRDAYRAILQIPAVSRAAVAPGMAAEITIPGLPGVTFRGTVRALLANTDNDTSLLPAEVWISDPQHRLSQGMAVNARLLTRSLDRRLFVPSQAVFAREGETYVYRVEGDEAHEQKIDAGREQGEETEVLSGLKEGDRVVRDGSLSLPDGAKVEPEP